MRKLASILLAMALLVLAGACWGRLPDPALKRGQQAEKLLQAGKTTEAVAAWEKIDQDYPGHAAVSLRLAEIQDQMGQYGPALFYYRRYVRLIKEGADPDAQSRLLTLERMATAQKGADEYAKTRGEDSLPVPVPTPVIERSKVQIGPDGAVKPVTGGEVGTSVPQMRPRAPIVLTPVGQSGAAPSRDEEYVLVTPIKGESTGGEVSTSQPVSEGKNRTVITVEPPSPFPAQPSVSMPVSQAQPGEAGSLPSSTPLPNEVGKMTSDLTRLASKFFTVSKGRGQNAMVRLTNGFDESIMTFGAIAAPPLEPVNAILTGGETRELDVPPGRYRVKIDVNNNAYPPALLYETEFEMVFDAGMTYTRSVSANNTRRID